MNTFARKAIEERIAKLKETVAFQLRQVQFLAGRLEEFKADHADTVNELIELEAYLSRTLAEEGAAEPMTASSKCPSVLDIDTPGTQVLASCILLKGHDGPHAGEGHFWNDRETNSTTCPSLPQHTSVIVG